MAIAGQPAGAGPVVHDWPPLDVRARSNVVPWSAGNAAMQWRASPHAISRMPGPEGMGEDVVVHDRPQLLERMATMASALGSWTVPVGIRPMQLPSSSQRSVQRSATPPGAADDVQVEPPLVVVMKKSVPVEAAEESAP